MQPLLSRAAVRAIDQDAVDRLGIPSLDLMENAGRGAFDAIVARFSDALDRVVVVGGPGQNGGDGWVVARHLVERGKTPIPVLVGDRGKVRGDAATNLGEIDRRGIAIRVVAPDDAGRVLPELLANATLVVDALFGTGLDRAVTGGYADAIRAIDAVPVPKVALDLPSGVDADTGQILGAAPRVALTVTFAARKRGLEQFPAAGLAGEVIVASIGVPPPTEAPWWLVGHEDLPAWLAPRAADAHKGTAGHLLVVGASPGKTGAAVLAAHAALRAGAGLATIATRPSVQAAVDAKVLEVMSLALDADDAAGSAVAAIAERDAAVVGPGLGLDAYGESLAYELAIGATRPTVLDADALTAIATRGIDTLRRAKAPRVLTPHPGEASRLLGVSTADVQCDRYAAATKLAERSGHVVILKGARTIVARPNGEGWVCRNGTPALGVAGTGDVLAGIVGACLAGGADAASAARTAVVLHARAGERAARGDRGLLAHEVADAVPDVIAEALRA